VETILQVIRVLRPFWHCFAYHETATEDNELPTFFSNIQMPKTLANIAPFHSVYSSFGFRIVWCWLLLWQLD